MTDFVLCQALSSREGWGGSALGPLPEGSGEAEPEYPRSHGHHLRIGGALNVTFHGVRGSTPCSGPGLVGYGGNTSCVILDRAGADPVILDLGTGLRAYGRTVMAEHQPFRGTALVSHLHWDHVQGLPFFAPVLASGARLDVFCPRDGKRSAQEAFHGFLSPPYFPVHVGQLPGEIIVHDVPGEPFDVGGAEVVPFAVPHVGVTYGYRITADGVTVAYVPDHQQPDIDPRVMDAGVVEGCAGADLLIHDAQFDEALFALRPDWGHCTTTHAVHLAAAAGVRTLALFHHDPLHEDARIDVLAAEARLLGERLGVEEVIAAAEMTTVALTASRSQLGAR